MGLFLFFFNFPPKIYISKTFENNQKPEKKKYMEGYLELVELYLFYVCVLLVDFLFLFDFRIFKRQRKEKM